MVISNSTNLTLLFSLAVQEEVFFQVNNPNATGFQYYTVQIYFARYFYSL